MPHAVLTALHASTVTDVHVLGRRGPQHAKWTTKELRELGELSGVGVVVDDGALPAEPPEGSTVVAKRNLQVLAKWAAREPSETPRRLHLHFGARPVEVLGSSCVEAVRLERTSPDGVGTGETWELPVQRVLRSVGYRSAGLPGVPFDDSTSTIPTVDSRVVRDGVAAPGEYVVGWIKRGPVGILGTNRKDAEEAVDSLRADAPALLAAREDDPGGVGPLLESRGLSWVDLAGWQAVLDREAGHGSSAGRGRVKIEDWDDLLEAAGRTRRP